MASAIGREGCVISTCDEIVAAITDTVADLARLKCGAVGDGVRSK